MNFNSRDEVLKLLAAAEAVVGEFCMVSDLLLGRPYAGFLALASLPEDLLGGDLDGRRRLVLHPRGTGKLDLCVPLGEEAKVGVRLPCRHCCPLSPLGGRI